MDTQDQINARRSVYSRLKLMTIQEEKKTLTSSNSYNVNSIDADVDPWKTATGAYRAQQLEYTKSHREEFERGPVPLDQQENHPAFKQMNVREDTLRVLNDKPSTIMARLATLRGRGRRAMSRCFDTMSEISSGPTPAGQPSICATKDFDTLSTVIPPTEILQNTSEICSNVSSAELRNKYFSGYKTNTSLPIYSHKTRIINSINTYGVVIIEGATGCGKTTQVPLYILEDTVLNRSSQQAPVIYVTQPRKIAARSIAERVCNEHNWDLGSLVGYQVGMDKVVGPQTVLVFCTAGVLLQKIIQERSLKSYTHIIIDEVHERDADTDLLLMMIRKLMQTESSIFHLIIMSATMDSPKVRDYFTFRSSYGHQAASTPSFVKITEQKSLNEVQIIYYDKLHQMFNYTDASPEIDLDQPELLDGCLRTAVKIIVEVIPHLDNYTEKSSSCLVFLPGMAEISKLDRMIKSCPGALDHLDIIPLHSCLASIDQLRVFRPPKPGCRKVILATNIAESSITVSDIGFIIDFCLTKTLMKDSITRFPTLKLQWSTKDKSTQRAGRTGRCCPGKVFRLVPSEVYDAFHDFAEPEILVAPLELSVLRIKNFNMGEIMALFALLLDSPQYNEIRTAILELKQIGALTSTYKNKLSDVDGDITSLGQIISSLPIDVHLSKLIVVAHVFDVIEDAIIIAACLSTNRTVFKHTFQDSLISYQKKLSWTDGSHSDLFLSLDVYKEFKEQKELRGKSEQQLIGWCERQGLDERKLHDVDSLVSEIKARLEYAEIHIVEQPNKERDLDQDSLMLKVAFCAAFYPNYFITDTLDAEQINKQLYGMDPTKTIVMDKIPMNQVPLFKTIIEEEISKAGIRDEFDYLADVSRAFLVYNDSNANANMIEDEKVARAIDVDGIIEPDRCIPMSIYRALKLGERLDLYVREFTNSRALDRMKRYNEYQRRLQFELGSRLVPTLMKIVVGKQPDNSHLLDSTPDEFADLTTIGKYYYEVPFDDDEDENDRKHFNKLHQYELLNTDSVDQEDTIYEPSMHRIRGPDSPIRMTFRSLLVKSRGYSVDIDPNSINSILLDPDYHKVRRQMLISATVCQNRRNRVMARDTTLMPNIRGLPTLMSLLFAQYYRLVYNQTMNCIAGAIFGIGWDENDKSLNRHYEIDLGFDVHITQTDIELINKARKRISDLLKKENLEIGKPRALIQLELRDIILTLLRIRRYPMQELDISLVDYAPVHGGECTLVKDKHNVPNEYINPAMFKDGDDLSESARPFLPLMVSSRHYSELEMYQSVRNNLVKLERIKLCTDGERIPQGGIKCFLCGNGVGNHMVLYKTLVDHLDSKQHLQNLREFRVFEQRAENRSKGV